MIMCIMTVLWYYNRPLEDPDDDDDDSDTVGETEDGRFEDGITLLDDIDEDYEEIPASY